MAEDLFYNSVIRRKALRPANEGDIVIGTK
jgi:hypothetical protein